MKQSRYIWAVLWFSIGGLICSAQEMVYTGNPDVSFMNARDLAFNGHRTEARDTLEQILTKYPDYTDVSSLLAKTHSWDGNYDTARKLLNRITSVERENKEAWIAAINNEVYAENYTIALGLTNKSMLYLDLDEDLVQLKDKIIALIEGSPAKEALIVPDTLETISYKNRIGVGNAFDIFDIVYDPMVYSSVEYRRETEAGSIIPRINYSNRFGIRGLQYELDFYPKLSKTFYAYLNYGYSNATIYPNNRAGVELYANLPKSMEASLGMRYLDFISSRATILTASFGLYKGNYYFSLRPYVTPRSDGPMSVSGSLLARKYLKDGENYLGVTAIYGVTPELRQLRADGVLLAETILYTESQQLLFEYQFTGNKRPNVYRANLGVTRQELTFEADRFFWAISAGIKYEVKF